ncbi:hypothetical protein MSG28_008096 [Choristoneura fumiferana]|uniref:Uncharacterized protein n=1 Tax=Choristoneura fumiferana TaxID=7141 RepID=A0ACC0JA04_CHOFU|nr:hypothetical protein MSG28_008096 [Choristoneura fumiferana]
MPSIPAEHSSALSAEGSFGSGWTLFVRVGLPTADQKPIGSDSDVPALARQEPEGANASARTAPRWPHSTRMRRASQTAHNRTLRSAPPVAIDHSFAVLSWEPVTMKSPFLDTSMHQIGLHARMLQSCEADSTSSSLDSTLTAWTGPE